MPNSARYVASGVTRNRYIEKENANAFKLTEMPDHVPILASCIQLNSDGVIIGTMQNCRDE